ncbi:hypothetical protein [Marinomonas transparens]|uniref:Uncharacterized protein n=1 Tax=Marinomonas transparens TaxID=2795388 RepID=A0A934JQJ3_9GAMM|nr:hypothetical protein [Marinomonas transparens]MBJ7537963.1 hypothetical protein [Marinomonas transparens]
METYKTKLIAEQMLGLTPEQIDELIDTGEDYDTPLQAAFGIDLATLNKIIQALVPLTPKIFHPKNHHLVHAFVRYQGEHSYIIASQDAPADNDT